MLMAISLAEKLGEKHGLLAFSVHPGTVGGTALGAHCDLEVDLPALSKFCSHHKKTSRICSLLIFVSEAVDRSFGNAEGWATGSTLKSQQRGAATYVYAAFDLSLKGK